MQIRPISPERMSLFSDAVIAVVITLMVLELRPPQQPGLAALAPLWLTAISYALSYLFIAIFWMNHHHLMRFVRHASPQLPWLNFAHLFAVSLLPFATSWVAETRFAPTPMAVYAAVFVVVHLAYLAFEGAVLRQADLSELPERVQLLARWRTFVTVTAFALAVPLALFVLWLAFALICAALMFYSRPEAPGAPS